MSLQVKIILHRGPNESELPRKEIRRFEIEPNAVGSYDYFRGKIIALYPDLTDESPFRLMWTDDEGDNVCFSSDEELSQAIKFINSQENKLFKCIVKFPQPQGPGQQPNQQQQPQQASTSQETNQSPGFASNPHSAFTPTMSCMFPGADQVFTQKKMEKMNEKIQNKLRKNMEKMQNMNKAQSQDIFNHYKQHWAQMGKVTKCSVDQTNGDVEMHVDIPIHHSDGTTTCTSTVTATVDRDGKATTSTSSNVYPDLEKQNEETMTTDQPPNDFEDLSQEAHEAKLNEAVAKMAELGFSGDWVRELLKNVNGDVAKAVEAMNPSK